jgi:allantoinase
MSGVDVVLRSQRVVTRDGVRAASIHVSRGKIARLAGWDADAAGAMIVDYENFVIMPGVFDTHVHVNEPGRTEWELFSSACWRLVSFSRCGMPDLSGDSKPLSRALWASAR